LCGTTCRYWDEQPDSQALAALADAIDTWAATEKQAEDISVENLMSSFEADGTPETEGEGEDRLLQQIFADTMAPSKRWGATGGMIATIS
jgi:hypothetical protein